MARFVLSGRFSYEGEAENITSAAEVLESLKSLGVATQAVRIQQKVNKKAKEPSAQ